MISASLRLRLFAIILLPLLAIAVAVGLWRIDEAQKTAEDLYDRNLLFTAVAVARDVALLDGDAIRFKTERLLSDTAGGPVRYHVYAPDGAFVTGYGVPPVPISRLAATDAPLTYFDAIHRGNPVRVLRMKDEAEIGGLSGTFTITVWQEQAVRQQFVQALALRAFAVMAALIGTVAVVVWFGVNLGLKPLLDLEEAVSRRSPEDLNPIRRKVPQEARGLVQRLNHLFGQTRQTIEAQNTFISNAAHQLRNPIAGIRALGDSVLSARTLDTAKARATELVAAADRASDLANRLLTLERVRTAREEGSGIPVDIRQTAAALIDEFRPKAGKRGVAVALASEDQVDPLMVRGDPVMLREALTNLLDNALVHGGRDLTQITLSLTRDGENAILLLTDDGAGIDPAAIPTAMARFGQVQPGEGSGLGLPIAEAVARRHGGTLELHPMPKGLTVRLVLKVA